MPYKPAPKWKVDATPSERRQIEAIDQRKHQLTQELKELTYKRATLTNRVRNRERSRLEGKKVKDHRRSQSEHYPGGNGYDDGFSH
jgi:hypothetical protein